MLETYEMKFIITNEDGTMIACYSDYESAEIDAKDLTEHEDNKDKKFHIYELTTSAKLGESILQKTYELKVTLPLPAEEKTEEQKESKEESKDEGKEEKEEKKEEPKNEGKEGNEEKKEEEKEEEKD
jgi:hypothetical protein